MSDKSDEVKSAINHAGSWCSMAVWLFVAIVNIGVLEVSDLQKSILFLLTMGVAAITSWVGVGVAIGLIYLCLIEMV